MKTRLWAVAAVALMGCGSTDEGAPASSFRDAPLTTVTSRDGRLKLAVFTSPEQPPSRGVIAAKLIVTDTTKGTAIDGLSFDITPEMPSMGHGTPTVPRVTAKGAGVYLAEDVDLYMAGRWDLRMAITGAVNDGAVVTIDVR